MRVWVIGRTVPEIKTGMMGLFEFEQAKALQEYGTDIQSCYLYADNRSVKVLRKLEHDVRIKDGVPVFGQAMPVGGLPQFLFQHFKTHCLSYAIKQCEKKYGKPDIIHVHFPLISLTNSIWNKLKSYHVPIFITEHWSKVQTGAIEPFRKALLSRSVEECTQFICVGYPLRDSVVQLTGTKKNIAVIPNMVDPDFYLESNQSNRDQFEYLFVGRLDSLKRVSVVIEAFSEAFAKQKDVRLTIIGGGPLEKSLKELASKSPASDRIKFLGSLPHSKVAQYMRNTDCFVSASILETFGVPFIEAWSCGKPVIAVKPSAIEHYLTEQNGLLVLPDNVTDMAEAMKRIYQNKVAFDSNQIAETASELFSQKAVVRQLEAFYHQSKQ